MKTLKLLFAGFLFIGLLGVSAQADLIVVPDDYTTIQDAVDAADSGDTILVGEGYYAGASIGVKIGPGPTYEFFDNKSNLKIIGSGEDTHITPFDIILLTFPAIPVDFTVPMPVGFMVVADGVEISHFSFDFPSDPLLPPPVAVMGYADNGRLSHLTITNYTSSLLLCNSSGWTITNNKISGLVPRGGDCGGIAVLAMSNIGPKDYPAERLKATMANDNIIAFNNINHTGVALGTPGEAYTGIEILSAFPGEELPNGIILLPLPGGPVENNKINHNKVMISVPDVPATGLQLLDFNPFIDEEIQTINNLVGFNDFRGCNFPEIVVAAPTKPGDPPQDLLDSQYNNLLSRNLGTGGLYDGLGPNRAYDGVPPTLFIPKMPK